MLSLYEKISLLCTKNGINITEMCKQSGVNRGSLTDLKQGRIKSLSSDTITKISGYFNVTVDHFLGNDQKENPDLYKKDELTFDDFTYAMYNEGKELTEESKKKLLEMAQFFRMQQDKENEKG